MAVQTPIPPNPIGENFAWRDWLQKLSDRVFGTASTLNIPIEPQYGGTGLTTYNTGDIIYSNSTNNLTRLPSPAATSLLQMTAAGVPSWSATGYGDTLNPYASKTANYFLAAPNGSAGVPTFRAVVAADIPTLNQNTSGSAATLTTTRAIYGNNFNGSAALTQVIASTYGGTGNGFTKFTGATTAEKTYSLPDATTTILTTNTAVTIAQGGTGQTTQAAALTALTGTQTSGYYVRSNGTNSVLAAIQAADIPTLNQNTSGNAATATNVAYSGLTGTVPTWNQNTTGTALNITATSNNTLTTLSALSLPNTQITGLGTMSTQNVGISTTVALAKLTVAGTNGSLTVSNGIITAYTAPT